MASIENAAEPRAWFKLERDVFKAGGRWTIAESTRSDRELRAFNPGSTQALTTDASGVERMDSSGAWLLLRTRRALEARGRKVAALTVPDRYAAHRNTLEQDDKPEERPRLSRMSPWRYRLFRIGKATVVAGQQGWRMLGYLGRV